MSVQQPRIQLLLSGDEIMSGDTVDTNSAMIAQRLGEFGLRVQRMVTLGDDADLLGDELRILCDGAAVVLVNGGLGPTVDDMTAAVVAAVAGVPLAEHAAARAHLESWCTHRGVRLNAANLKQAMLPQGAAILDNPIGSAVGFQLPVNGCLVICTPGVPGELRAMLEQVLANMQQHLGSFARSDTLRLQTFGLGESTAQQLIADADFNWPDGVELGFRAGAPLLEIKLGIHDPALAAAQRQCRRQLEQLFGDHIIGTGNATLPGVVLQLLAAKGQTLTAAESCTGGLIASQLTRVAGASATFHAGFVTYSDAIKQALLGVRRETLAEHGAVSEAVVREMLAGALSRAAADYGIAVSGTAGPAGGTPDKPVGTVWLAWGRADKIRSLRLCWPLERELFQTLVAAAGLDVLRRTLLGLDAKPRYFAQRGGGRAPGSRLSGS